MSSKKILNTISKVFILLVVPLLGVAFQNCSGYSGPAISTGISTDELSSVHENRDILKKSDIILSPRFSGSFYKDSNWQDAYEGFRATRISWSYGKITTNQEKIAVNEMGIKFGGTFEAWIPSLENLKVTYPEKTTSELEQIRKEMACYDKDGEEIAVFKNQPNRSSQAWKEYLLVEAKKLVEKGVTSFHQDGAKGAWSMYVNGGCYVNGKAQHYIESTASFINFMRAGLEDHVSELGLDVEITISGNVGTHDDVSALDWIHSYFDFYLSEHVPSHEPGPNPIIDIARFTRSKSLVSALVVESTEVLENKRSIASAYALGLSATAPWDSYIPGSDRYFGDPQDYLKLSNFITDNKSLLDDYEVFEEGNSFTESIKTGTGYITEVKTVNEKKTIFWSRQADYKDIENNKTIYINGIKSQTIGNSEVGNIYVSNDVNVSAGDILSFTSNESVVSVAQSQKVSTSKLLHYVNWSPQPRSITISLDRGSFSNFDDTIVVLKSSGQTQTIEPIFLNGSVIIPKISIDNAGWAIIK